MEGLNDGLIVFFIFYILFFGVHDNIDNVLRFVFVIKMGVSFQELELSVLVLKYFLIKHVVYKYGVVNFQQRRTYLLL